MDTQTLQVLEEKYGLSIIEDIRNESDLINDNYHKVESLSVVDNLRLLEFMKNTVEREIIKREFSGAFKVDVNPKDLADAVGGGKRGFVYKNGHIKKHAKLTSIKDEVDNYFDAFALTDAVFSVMSVAIGEYFKAQINEKLKDILGGIHEISLFLEDDKLCELQAGYDELQELYDHLQYVKDNTDRKNLNLERIRSIMHIARKDMLFYRKQIENIKNSAGNRDKRDLAKENVGKIVMALTHYRLSLAIFCETKLTELYLSDVMDPDELDMFRQSMEDHITGFIETYRGAREWSRKYYLTHNLVEESDKLPFIDSIDSFLGISQNKVPTKTTQFSGETATRMNAPCVDPDDLFIPVRSLDKYIEVMREGFEFVYLDDNIYTNIPISVMGMDGQTDN